MTTDPLIPALRSLVKRRPERLLVVGGFPDLDLGADLEPGDTVAAAGVGSVAGDGGFDLAVWRPPPEGDAEALGRLRALLAQRGRLLAVLPSAARRRWVVDLSEAGFVIAGEHRVDPRLLVLVARRDDFVVRAYRPGDEADILRLFGPSFHVERSPEHWRWKYLDNPWGRLAVTIARSADGELAAHYAGYHVPFVRLGGGDRSEGGAEMLALQIGDTMTDPRFRHVGRGPTSLLGRCVRHCYAAHCEGRVAFNYGFNTGNIQRFSLRFVGAHRLEPVGYWRCPSRRAGGEARAWRRYRVAAVDRLDSGWDRFFRRVAPHYGFLVQRGMRYLRWRYLQCPDRPRFHVFAARRWGRLVGWSVFRRREHRLLWADALFHPDHASAAGPLLAAALATPELSDVEEVTAWFPERPAWWPPHLEALGFERAPEPDDLAVMFVPHARGDTEELLRGLYYTLGDGDLV